MWWKSEELRRRWRTNVERRNTQQSFRGGDLDLNYVGCAEDLRGLERDCFGYARVRYRAQGASMGMKAGPVSMYVDHVNYTDKQHQQYAHAHQRCIRALPAAMEGYHQKGS